MRKVEKAKTALEKAEAVLGAMRGELRCRCCHEYVARNQIVKRNDSLTQTSNTTIARLPCCRKCFKAWPAPGRRGYG